MKQLFRSRSVLVAVAAFGALAAGSAAHARTDVVLSIGVPFGYVQPAPVYVQPRPVYVQPQPVYVQPRPVYYQAPQVYYRPPVYVQPQPVYHHGHRPGRGGAWGDADRDGVPNRYDDAPRNPYRH